MPRSKLKNQETLTIGRTATEVVIELPERARGERFVCMLPSRAQQLAAALLAMAHEVGTEAVNPVGARS